jgi:alkylated DNA repair dioxygenase AlkB
MTPEFKFFASADDEAGLPLLEGYRYKPELISAADETALIARVRELPFREFEFHGYLGKRRVVSFGWQYDFSGGPQAFSKSRLRKADDIPEFLLPIRALAASFAGLGPAALQHVLVTEYGPGAGIGWHRDKAVFGQVVGISLLTPCVLRFRRKKVKNASSDSVKLATRLGAPGHSRQSDADRSATSKPVKRKREWERMNVVVDARSAYHLSGPARFEWEHSILRVDELRYSITFRNMLED